MRATFAGAFQILAAAAVNRASALRNSRDEKAFSFRGHEDPEEGSILSAIIHVTQEVSICVDEYLSLLTGMLVDYQPPKTDTRSVQ